MSFKFRLETNLRLAQQEMEIAQGLLAQEMRTMQSLLEQKRKQEIHLDKAWQGQRRACLTEPISLGTWQRYAVEQKNYLTQCVKKVENQQKIVEEYREKLLQCRIKVEKYERLKEKKMRLYYIEELRKEQKEIDEIAQR